MKKCPHCAELIQDEAIKCKHCGERLGPAPTAQQSMQSGAATGSDRSRPALLSPFFWLVEIVGIGFFLYLAYRGFNSIVQGAALRSLGSAAIFAIAAPIIWLIADGLRRAAMPTLYFANGFVDLLSKKFFWMVGPQLIGLGLLCWFLIAWSAPYILDVHEKYQPTNQAVISAPSASPAKPTSSQVASPVRSSTAAPTTPVSSQSRQTVPESTDFFGKCLLEVNRQTYIDGECDVTLEPDGSFFMGAGHDVSPRYFVYLNTVSPNQASGNWNGREMESHAGELLGNLVRNGDCWRNETVKVCTWKN